MEKKKILEYVTELQEIREHFNNDVYFSTLPTEHCLVNFNEAMDDTVEAVMQVYSEAVLFDIQNKNENNHESRK